MASARRGFTVTENTLLDDLDSWSNIAFAAIETLARSGVEFDANSVRDLVGDPPSPSMLGAVLAEAGGGR